jgi:hypothetical protein
VPWLTLLLVDGLLLGAGAIRSHHLLHLMADTHALDHLDVFQPSENLVLDLEDGLHAELGALLDSEGLVLERVDCAGGLEVNDNVRPSVHLEAEREDDAFAGVALVRDVLAGAESERLFPLAEGLVVLVCRRSVLEVCERRWEYGSADLAGGTHRASSSRQP